MTEHEEQPRQTQTDNGEGSGEDSRKRHCLAEARKYYEKKDPEYNRDTTPPEDERVEVHSVWVAECYAPSHTAKLVSGIERLGWDQEQVTDYLKGGVSGWLNEGRAAPYGGSYLNLGPIQRPGTQRFIGSNDRVAELPEGVDYARGYALNILPSLTIITLQFVLMDEAATILDLREPADSAKRLQSVQADLVRASSDLLPMASELEKFSGAKGPVNRLAEEFEPITQSRRNISLQLIEDLRQNILDRSRRLQMLEEQVRQVLMASGSVAATIAQERATKQNLNLQGDVVWLTRVLVILTIVLVAIGTITIWATVRGS